MKKVDAGTRNIGFNAAMSASYKAALPMINGALIQLLLADKGLGTVQIGTFATVVQLSTLIGTMVFSKVADKSNNPLRSTRVMYLCLTGLSLCYLPLIKLSLPAGTILILASCLAAVITGLAALKGIMDYKIPYQIIPLDRYGNMIFFDSAINGVVGIALSFCFSQIIALEPMGEPYFFCMLLASGLLLCAWFCNGRLKPIGDPAALMQKKTMSTKQLWEMFRSPKFMAIVPPTLLRGITFGITGSVVLIMLNMGYTEAEASRLPIITACGSLVAAGIHRLLCHKVKMPNIGTVGSIFLLSVLFLPRGNTLLFYFLYLLVYTGQILIDCTIPIMVIHIVEPQIAGAYNAWRNTLLFLVSTISTYVTAVLLEKGLVWVVLVACAAGYSLAMILHKKMYYRFAETNR